MNIDTAGPIVSAIKLNKTIVDVSATSQTITATVNVTDATGVNLARLPSPYWYNVTDIGTRINSDWALASGDIRNGTYSTSIVIPTTAKAGDWLMGFIAFYDTLGFSSTNGGYSEGFKVGAPFVNSAPVANAGTNQSVVLGAVTLDGTASLDANGDTLTYKWVLLSKPISSNAALSSTTSPRPTFSADAAGTFLASLIVNDGKVDSPVVLVSVTASAANSAPVANAGANQSVVLGNVTLDGTASLDANNDTLTFKWSLVNKPAGSSVALSSATSAKPTFTADVAGTYVLTLIVNDGKVDSAVTAVSVTASAANSAPVANFAPIANAGLAQSVVAGTVVTLDGTSSTDANNDPLTYKWFLTSNPYNSTATLSSSSSVKPTFITDVAGTYVFSLIVNDGKVDSAVATIAVKANLAAISDTTPPSIRLLADTTPLIAGQTKNITFFLSEPSSNFLLTDITVTGGALSNWVGYGDTYTALFTPATNSTADGVLSVGSGVFTDTAQNANADGSDANNTITLNVDTVIPTIALSTSKTNLIAGETATLTFVLSEASTTFSVSDVSVTGGVLSNFTGSRLAYTATFIPAANSTANGFISVPSGVFTDAAGNKNADGSDANNFISFSRIPTNTNETHSLSVIVDKNVLGSDAVLLKGLKESMTFTNGALTKHIVEYSGLIFDYSQIDSLITTVTRDDEFTSEFTKEINDYLGTELNITYSVAVKLVGIASIDEVILSVAGADGDFVA